MLTEKLLCFYQTIFAICLQGQIYVASSIRVTMFCVFCVLFSFVVFVCLIVSLFACLFVCFVLFVWLFLFLFSFLFFCFCFGLCFLFASFFVLFHTHQHTYPPPPPLPTHTIVDFRCGEYLCICYVIYFRRGDIFIIFVL